MGGYDSPIKINNTNKTYNLTTTTTTGIQQNSMVFTGYDDQEFPRTRELLIEEPKIDTHKIYTRKLWNINYFFERKRSELWLDDDKIKIIKITKSNNKNNITKLSAVDKLLIFNEGNPSYMLPIKNLKSNGSENLKNH